ncbi:MAG: type II secretion system protein GspF [Nitrospinae bacterium]|nr:type II secretion system protein GspF [Nitrospinota bacterium]MZH04400.1 type II secretion system protein GspF [Nitrospinota bacterium]MZH14804.1 type II secretion system protein GspF [Nitrospinota bacterium]
MTVYYYKATDQNGKYVEGDISAPDYKGAVQKIRKLNYFPVKVSEGKKSSKLSPGMSLPLPAWGSPIPTKDLMTLTQQLATLVDSGLTLDDALSTLIKLAETVKTKTILSEIRKQVHGGSSFADALAEHPKVFSKLYVNMIRAGEAGGILGETLSRLAMFMEKSVELKNSIRSAMVYPAILTFVGGTAVVILITFVIPQFSKLFEEMGAALPLPTQIMLGISSAIINYWPALILGTLGFISAFTFYIGTRKGRLRWDGILLKLPLFGPLIRKIEVSRFSLTMATLLKSGVPILQAMGIVQSILINRVIADSVINLKQALKRGKGLSGPLEEAGIFPPMAVHMITVGETSGALDEMLTKVSKTYDKEVEQSIKQVISLIEPMMILLMALIIGFIVISMLLAIFSANDISF